MEWDSKEGKKILINAQIYDFNLNISHYERGSERDDERITLLFLIWKFQICCGNANEAQRDIEVLDRSVLLSLDNGSIFPILFLWHEIVIFSFFKKTEKNSHFLRGTIFILPLSYHSYYQAHTYILILLGKGDK